LAQGRDGLFLLPRHADADWCRGLQPLQGACFAVFGRCANVRCWPAIFLPQRLGLCTLAAALHQQPQFCPFCLVPHCLWVCRYCHFHGWLGALGRGMMSTMHLHLLRSAAAFLCAATLPFAAVAADSGQHGEAGAPSAQVEDEGYTWALGLAASNSPEYAGSAGRGSTLRPVIGLDIGR